VFLQKPLKNWRKVTELFFVSVLLVLLLLLDLITIAARTSMLQTSNARLLALREHMGEKVNQMISLLSNLPSLRAGFHLLVILLRFFIAALTLLIIFILSISTRWVIAGLVLSGAAFVLFWLEWLVERIVLSDLELWALRFTGYARVVLTFSKVLLFPFALSSNHQHNGENQSFVTEDELKSLVDAGQEEGVFELVERKMIYSIFELGETLAREIMVPRIDMLALDVVTPMQDAVDAFLESGYSRAPVFEETVDNTLGLLYAKDLLRAWREGGEKDSLKGLLRPAYFVPEAKKVDELLAEMQVRRIHMAVIVDEYGGVAGLVTLEDIVEEIFGEIQDEYDQGEEDPYKKLSDGSYIFMGRIDLDDFNEIMGSSLPSDEADTLGGYIYSQLGRVPIAGEKVQKENLLLTVEQVSARRIGKVGAQWLPLESQDEETNHVE
jgi:putative hemolysin